MTSPAGAVPAPSAAPLPRAGAGLFELGALAAEHADTLVLGAVRDAHRSIAGRVHAAVDAVAGHRTVPHLMHDAIAASVYTGVSLGLRGSAGLLRGIERRGFGPAAETSRSGRHAVAVVNGLIGDALVERGSSAAISLAVRHQGRDLPLRPGPVAEAFPAATPRLVVFVHGLCESEHVWQRAARPRREEPAEDDRPDYGTALAASGWTPVYLRVNTGLAIRESGVALHALLQELLEVWPVPVDRIALVGHSMGGLIARAACGLRAEPPSGRTPWVDRTSDLISLGSPHLGSPVERSIARSVRLAARVPELGGYVRIFEQRSRGVLDLHDGMPEPDPLPAHVRVRLVAATLTGSATHPAARTVGDLLVPYASALGRHRHGELFPGADVLHVPGSDHFDLLNHDDVRAALKLWLSSPAPRPEGER